MSEHLHREQMRYLWDSPTALREMTDFLIRRLAGSTRPVVLVCIGTDRSTGDSLGPLTGTLLKERYLKQMNVYGTLDEPVHAKNLHGVIAEIEADYDDPFIIAVDACLGRRQNVGTVVVGDGPLYPGSALSRELPPVGNMHITGIVNVAGFMELSVLQNTRLHTVMNIAKLIASAIKYTDWKLHRENEAIHEAHTNVVLFKRNEKTAEV
ncbi:spore protease YyaC [Alkalicoccus luteus]|uniref:Spore protease YyaC n=1 Tax=Alkalicoccus luteus TaxID=1237094 RepID=A0A969TSY5_9BACI|nr:spore protease YyaC [Alkalicoccus luteus]NJP37073.1 spore protease YyaC [Alkalicoccus luteus]